MALRDQSKWAVFASSINLRTFFALAATRSTAYSRLPISKRSTTVEITRSRFSSRFAKYPASFRSMMTWYIVSACVWGTVAESGGGVFFSGVLCVSICSSGVCSFSSSFASFSALVSSYVSCYEISTPRTVKCGGTATHRKLLTEMLKQIRLGPLYTLLTLDHPRKQKAVVFIENLC